MNKLSRNPTSSTSALHGPNCISPPVHLRTLCIPLPLVKLRSFLFWRRQRSTDVYTPCFIIISKATVHTAVYTNHSFKGEIIIDQTMRYWFQCIRERRKKEMQRHDGLAVFFLSSKRHVKPVRKCFASVSERHHHSLATYLVISCCSWETEGT